MTQHTLILDFFINVHFLSISELGPELIKLISQVIVLGYLSILGLLVLLYTDCHIFSDLLDLSSLSDSNSLSLHSESKFLLSWGSLNLFNKRISCLGKLLDLLIILVKELKLLLI